LREYVICQGRQKSGKHQHGSSSASATADIHNSILYSAWKWFKSKHELALISRKKKLIAKLDHGSDSAAQRYPPAFVFPATFADFPETFG
jgi:hypothetical protein